MTGPIMPDVPAPDPWHTGGHQPSGIVRIVVAVIGTFGLMALLETHSDREESAIVIHLLFMGENCGRASCATTNT